MLCWYQLITLFEDLLSSFPMSPSWTPYQLLFLQIPIHPIHCIAPLSNSHRNRSNSTTVLTLYCSIRLSVLFPLLPGPGNIASLILIELCACQWKIHSRRVLPLIVLYCMVHYQVKIMNFDWHVLKHLLRHRFSKPFDLDLIGRYFELQLPCSWLNRRDSLWFSCIDSDRLY